jgi:regulator of sigma E protease
MLEKVFIFILFLFPLVFFHELGHFLFARFFGVRVEVFSLGFGPKLFKFKKGDTEYCWSLIPLGGYVKMFGDDPMKMDEIPEADRHASFTYKSKMARFWIVFGGPLANFIFTYFIFFFLLLSGEKVPEIKLGVVQKETILHTQGFKTGDTIKKVNGNKIFDFTDMPFGETEKIFSVTVLRNGENQKLITEVISKELVGEIINNSPILRKPVLTNTMGEKFSIVSFTKDGKKFEVNNLDSLAESTFENLVIRDSKNIEKELLFNSSNRATFFTTLASNGFYPIDLRVKSINMNSPADESGIEAGNVVFAINDLPIRSFIELKDALNKTDSSEYSVSTWSNGKRVNKKIIPEIKVQGDKKIKLLGIYSDGEWLPPALIKTESKGIIGSFGLAFSRTWNAIEKTVLGFKKLITSEVSFKNIGGPISIGKVAADSFNTSLSYFFQIMALISVNLGVINLFPIPVLDGGHIMFIGLEIINRGPLSRRKMEIAQQFGLSLLLLLTFAALFNDFSRLF